MSVEDDKTWIRKKRIRKKNSASSSRSSLQATLRPMVPAGPSDAVVSVSRQADIRRQVYPGLCPLVGHGTGLRGIFCPAAHGSRRAEAKGNAVGLGRGQVNRETQPQTLAASGTVPHRG